MPILVTNHEQIRLLSDEVIGKGFDCVTDSIRKLKSKIELDELIAYS